MAEMLRVKVKFNRFGRIGERAREGLSRAVRAAAFTVEGKAKALLVEKGAVDTGNLLNSIATVVEDRGLTAFVGTAVHYAPYIEYGTYKMAARPYLVPAVEFAREPFQAACAAALRAAG